MLVLYAVLVPDCLCQGTGRCFVEGEPLRTIICYEYLRGAAGSSCVFLFANATCICACRGTKERKNERVTEVIEREERENIKKKHSFISSSTDIVSVQLP